MVYDWGMRIQDALRIAGWAGLGGGLALNCVLLPIWSMIDPLYEGGWWMVGGIALLSAAFIAGASLAVFVPVLVFGGERWLRLKRLCGGGALVGVAVFEGWYLLGDRTPSGRSILFCAVVGAFTGAVTGACGWWLRRNRMGADSAGRSGEVRM